MLKKIIIFPFGGNSRESLLSIFAINKIKKEWDVMGFIDDDPQARGKECCGIKVLGSRGFLRDFKNVYALAIPGNPFSYLKRRAIINSLKLADSRFATIIHPSVVVSPDARIGHNTLLMANVVVSCNVRIGNHCIILPNTVISHDSIIGDYTCIGSNVSVSGHVRIGSECYIGSGTKIRGCISVGNRTLVGLGANVISDVKEGVVCAGNPARPIRKRHRK